MKIYIDGKFYDKKDAKVSVFDHGLLYGDGIFEGIRAYNGRVFRLEEHIDRLYDSAKAIWMTIPMSKEKITVATVETCRMNHIRDGYIRLLVTRGEGDLGLSPTKCPKPSVIIIAATIELYPEEFYKKGLKVMTVPTQRISPAALSPAIKSLNYLNNIMAKVEGHLMGVHEVIMLNHQGYVAECSGDNIFAVKRGCLYTPPVYAGALGGITRQVVIDMARQLNLTLKETTLTRYDLFVADEIFLTGTGAEIIPVVELDGRAIGEGKVGKWTQKFMKAYSILTRREGTPIYKK
ncbi:MAG: branched-chain-amino-acid transaminase [Verrucomicrobiota bacterium]